MTNWEIICDYVFKSDECKDIHKFGSIKDGWINISDKNANVYKVTKDWTLTELKQLLNRIRQKL